MLREYFGEGVFYRFETLPDARKAAVSAYDLGGQKLSATEWWDWNKTVGATGRMREHLDVYGVDLDFSSEAEARQFMNEIYDELIVAIRIYEGDWKP